jgi:hypothetical protein
MRGIQYSVWIEIGYSSKETIRRVYWIARLRGR